MMMTSRVNGKSAGISLPHITAPFSHTPSTSGDAAFATTSRPGSAWLMTAIAKAPRTLASARRVAVSRSLPSRTSRKIRCAISSVSVSLTIFCPRSLS